MLASYADVHEHPYPPELRLGEGLHRPVRRGTCAACSSRMCPPDTTPVGSVFFHALPRNLVVFPVVFEGQIKAVIGLASLKEFTAVTPGLPRTADGQHRHRAQQHRGDDADRRAAEAVAAARGRTADAAEGAAADQRAARRRRRSSSPSRTPRSNARTRKSSRRAARSKTRRPSWR